MKPSYLKAILLLFPFILLSRPIYAQKQGQQLIDSLLIEIPKMKDDTNKVMCLHNVAYNYFTINPNECIKFAHEVLELSLKLRWKFGMGKGYNDIALGYYKNDDYPNALANFQNAINVYNEINNRNGVAIATCNMGMVFDRKGEYIKTLEYYLRALNIHENIKEEKGIAIVSLNIGLFYENQGLYGKALEFDFRALKINEQLNSKIQTAICLNNIGFVYYKECDYRQALEYYFRALKISNEVGSREGIAREYRNIGCVYTDENKCPEALDYLSKAIGMDTNIAKEGTLRDYRSIGHAYYKMKDYGAAIKNYQTALSISKEVDYKIDIADQLKNIGVVYVAIAQKAKYADSAFVYLQSALVAGKQIRARNIVQEAFKNLSDLYRLKGLYKQALTYTDSALILKDSIFSVDNNLSVALQGVEYQYYVKHYKDSLNTIEKERIDSLKLQRQQNYIYSVIGGSFVLFVFSAITAYNYNRRRKLALEKKIAETEMTALRAQMNPHFIFNALNSIHAYIQDNNNKTASSYLLKFSALTRAILENSMHQSVPLTEEINALKLYLSLEQIRLDNKLEYAIIIAADIDLDNTLIPPLILQPFIENAILHGLQHKDGGGKVTIEVNKQNNMLHCIIADNGIGRQQAGANKKGLYAGKKESLGMKLTEQRIAIINQSKKANAYVTITDVENNNMPAGVRIELVLPLEERF